MHHLRIAGQKFDRVHVALRVQAERQDEAAVQVRTIGRDCERLRHARDQVRMREPRAVEVGHGGQGCGVTPCGSPSATHRRIGLDLSLRQSARAETNSPCPDSGFQGGM